MCPCTTLECVLLEIWLRSLCNTLSHKDHLDTTDDNVNTPILPDPMVINALDLALPHHILSSSTSDPFVFKALAALDEGSPLFTCANLSDWSFDKGHLYFHKCLYVPPSACSALLHSIHCSLSQVTCVVHALPAMVFFFLFLFMLLFAAFLLTIYVALCKPGCAVSAADTSSV